MPSLRPLRISARITSALGLASITLTGEIAPAWLAAGWMVWFGSWVTDRFSGFGARVHRSETAAVVVMMAALILDLLVLHTSFFVALTHFLLLFQIVKLAGEKTRKDCFQIFLFSFFQILAACTLSVDAWHAIILLAFIPTSTAALFWNQLQQEYERAQTMEDASVSRHHRRMAVGICLATLPINLLLTAAVFIIFPRLTLNASLPGFGGNRAGFTDQVNLDQTGNLEQDSTVVLWMSFPKPQERALWNGYLRGDVLNQFNGKRWSASKNGRSKALAPDPNNLFILGPQKSALPLIHQSILMTDTSAGILFVVGHPLRVSAPLRALQQNEGGSLGWSSSWNRPLRYDVASDLAFDGDALSQTLELPSIPLQNIERLAEEIAGSAEPKEQARRIEQYLRSNYRYSTAFGERLVENPVEDFLLNRKEGLCGHFASAMAVMLRLRRIPSRIVTGYFKGEWNEPAQSVTIRKRDAHAWVEAYLPGQGWVSFDPTPDSPERRSPAGRTMWRVINQYWDYLNLIWNRFIIQYDFYSQIKAFQTLQKGSGQASNSLVRWWSRLQARWRPLQRDDAAPTTQQTSPQRFPWERAVLFSILAIGGGAWMMRRKPTAETECIQFYKSFLKRMANAGLSKKASETGWEFAARIGQQHPEHARLCLGVTQKYYQWRFGPRKETP